MRDGRTLGLSAKNYKKVAAFDTSGYINVYFPTHHYWITFDLVLLETTSPLSSLSDQTSVFCFVRSLGLVTSGVRGWVIKVFSVGAIGRFHEGCLSGFRRCWSMILADGWCLGLVLQEIFCPKRWVEIFHEGAFSQNCTVVQWARVFSLHM